MLRAGPENATPALSILLQVSAVKPDVPYLVWARDWLERIRSVHQDSGPLMLATARLARSAE